MSKTPLWIIRTDNGFVGRWEIGMLLEDSMPEPLASSWKSIEEAAAVAKQFASSGAQIESAHRARMNRGAASRPATPAERREDEPCERGTIGCSIMHGFHDSPCETW